MAYTTANTSVNLNVVINEVTRTKQRIALTQRGKPVVAIIPFEDLEYLEAIESAETTEDIEACKTAEKESMRPFADVMKELDL